MKNKLFSKSKQIVYDACLIALEKFNCKILSKDFDTGLIKAKKGVGLFAYGHAIDIGIQVKESQKTEAIVTSNLIGIQVFGWGTDSENEEEIVKLITDIVR